MKGIGILRSYPDSNPKPPGPEPTSNHWLTMVSPLEPSQLVGSLVPRAFLSTCQANNPELFKNQELLGMSFKVEILDGWLWQGSSNLLISGDQTMLN